MSTKTPATRLACGQVIIFIDVYKKNYMQLLGIDLKTVRDYVTADATNSINSMKLIRNYYDTE